MVVFGREWSGGMAASVVCIPLERKPAEDVYSHWMEVEGMALCDIS